MKKENWNTGILENPTRNFSITTYKVNLISGNDKKQN
jgi:hypothetical protein